MTRAVMISGDTGIHRRAAKCAAPLRTSGATTRALVLTSGRSDPHRQQDHGAPEYDTALRSGEPQ
ncbi:hypothetical protein [Spirillospora sp. CA-294931]|uniref:hypothetical protein n=1 Tax=Spirillospora sp. CA-294931 TaxID=3240042 RepID=UPI003D9449D4